MPNGNEMSLMTHMVLTGGQTFARLLLFSMPLFDKDFCLNNVQNNVFFFNLEVALDWCQFCQFGRLSQKWVSKDPHFISFLSFFDVHFREVFFERFGVLPKLQKNFLARYC